MYTLKVNIRAQEEREKREKERLAREALSKIQATAGPAAGPRKRRGLNFHEPGTFISQAEQLQKKARIEALQKRIADAAAKTGIADAAKLASLTTQVIPDKNTDSGNTTNVRPDNNTDAGLVNPTSSDTKTSTNVAGKKVAVTQESQLSELERKRKEKNRKKRAKLLEKHKEESEIAESVKQSWQSFQSQPRLKGVKKGSIFASPCSAKGKVGVGTNGIADAPSAAPPPAAPNTKRNY